MHRWLTGAAAVIAGMLAITFGVLSGPLPAQATDAHAFDPAEIISDANFYDSNAMTATDVQNFLNQHVPTCHPEWDGSLASTIVCLKDYHQQTTAKSADKYCNGYSSQWQSAAQIIDGVARSCGISQKVILVMLQKEEALVNHPDPSPYRYTSAMGYACPDGAACDAQYYGFFNQVYGAARQFKLYQANPSWYRYVAGQSNYIQWSPNAACGGSTVNIRNQATAALYIYTPYQPNAAALNAGYGTGDGCSSYGNRNFFLYYTDWFGSPTVGNNFYGSIDAVSATDTGTSGTISVDGWAFDANDPTKAINADVYVTRVDDGSTQGTRLTANGSRPDVANVFSAMSVGSNHGYDGEIQIDKSGTYNVCIYAVNGSDHLLLGCRTVDDFAATAGTYGSFDTATAQSNTSTAKSLRVTGWTVDQLSKTTPTKVQVTATGASGADTSATATADGSRPDVATAFSGVGSAHGFDTTVNVPSTGTYNVCVSAIGTNWKDSGQSTSLGCKTVNLLAPQGSFDGVSLQADADSASLFLHGWAFDATQPSQSIFADTYVTDPTGKTIGYRETANASRPDVNAYYASLKITGSHGYSFDAPITRPGTYRICSYAIGAAPANATTNTTLGCQNYTVNGGAPFGSYDTAKADGNGITVTGWSIDENGPTAATYVDIYVTDSQGKALGYRRTANQSRPDVAAVFSSLNPGDDHGFIETVPATSSGTNRVCAYAITLGSLGSNTLLGCKTVEVK
jgi:hypothetical protein